VTALVRTDRRVYRWTIEGRGAGREYHLWTLTGTEGATQVKAWRDLPGSAFHAVALRFPDLHVIANDGSAWMGADLGYHSRVPRYECQDPITLDCDLIGGGVCYYDGSGLSGERIVRLWIHCAYDDGVIWDALHCHYDDILGEL
jgi:hypothetical protein